MMLAYIWYFVILFSMICYAMLDGFDLGVGLLHLFARGDEKRRIFLNSIGPVWDGNEVWLVIVAGALFAGFPEVFATIFSAFYTPTTLLLMGLIYRAVSIEFRSKRPSNLWRNSWDTVFAGGSLVIAFGVGLLLANLIDGIPLDADHNFVGSFLTFVQPYDLLVGAMTVALFAMHGSIYLVMKTDGELRDQLRSWVPRCIALFLILYFAATGATLYHKPYMIDNMHKHPSLFLVPAGSLASILFVPYLMRKKRDGWAFLASCLTIALLISLVAIGTFPHIVRSSISPQTNSLLISNSASSPLTLKVLLIIVAAGVPLVLAYGFYIYRIFGGKVELDASSY